MQIHLDVRHGGDGSEIVGEGPRDGLKLVGFRARGDAQSVDLAGDHPGPEAHPFGAARHLAGRGHLDRRPGHGAGGGRESKILSRVVRRIDAQQRHQIAETLDENGVEIQTRVSWEESRGKVPFWASTPQLRRWGPETRPAHRDSAGWSGLTLTLDPRPPMADAASTPDRQDLLAAELAELYLIEEELGRGGSATVYLAQDLRHGRRVALKVLHSALGAALGVERFQREIRTQARLQHPLILPLFDSGSAAGRLFYTMPYVEAGSLRDRLRRIGRLDTGAALQVALEVASALAYAHTPRHHPPRSQAREHHALADRRGDSRGLRHRLRAGGGRGRRGNRHASEPRLTETGVTVGTPTYMSPEQAAGDEDLTGRSDQYSLAAVVYEALAGVAPFTGPNARAILARKLTSAPRPLAGSARPDVPEVVERVLMRALSRHPDDRYESMEAFAQALVETGAHSAITPVSLPRMAPRLPDAAAAPAAARGLPILLLALAGGGCGCWPGRSRDGASVAAGSGEPGARGAALQEPGRSRRPVLRRRPDRGADQPAGRPRRARVISRTSAEQYRESPKSLKEIGAELQAGYLLEGSVRWERGDRGARAGSGSPRGSSRWPTTVRSGGRSTRSS